MGSTIRMASSFYPMGHSMMQMAITSTRRAMMNTVGTMTMMGTMSQEKVMRTSTMKAMKTTKMSWKKRLVCLKKITMWMKTSANP